VLVKSAESLEMMEKVDTLVVDKTGTLTQGKPRLVSVTATGGYAENELLRLAASLEQRSEHPSAVPLLRAPRSAAWCSAWQWISSPKLVKVSPA